MDQQERAGLRKCPESFQGAQEGKKEKQLSIHVQPLHEASALHPRMRPRKMSGREEVEVARQIYLFPGVCCDAQVPLQTLPSIFSGMEIREPSSS